MDHTQIYNCTTVMKVTLHAQNTNKTVMNNAELSL